MVRRGLVFGFGAAVIAILSSCGGGGGPTGGGDGLGPSARGLVYTDPGSTGWCLVRNISSTPSKVILDLVSPQGTSGLGAGFILVADSRVQWTKVDSNDADFLHNRAFDLTAQPAMAKGLSRDGELQVGVFQNRLDRPVVYQGPLLSVSLCLTPGAAPQSEIVLPIRVRKAKHVKTDGISESITIQVGELRFRP